MKIIDTLRIESTD